MVAAPWSTVDLSMADGSHIEIEERPGEEVTVLGGVRLAPEASQGFNPAFDVTPARLVDAVATERGVAEPRTGTDLRALA
jgi:methylthioribose-1-phosphate isomerase